MVNLQKTKSGLKKEAEKQMKLQEEAITSKNDEIEIIFQELKESQTCIEEMRLDHESMSEEMEGLGSAYNALEQKYHHINISDNSTSAPTEMTAGGEPAAEEKGVRDHYSGEAASEDQRQNNNHDFQSLQDENVHLREESRAANEWMSMAVKKMEEMNGENETSAHLLDEARASICLSITANSSTLTELDDLCREAQQSCDKIEAQLSAKYEDLALLEGHIEEMKFSPANQDDSYQTEELKQDMVRKEVE